MSIASSRLTAPERREQLIDVAMDAFSVRGYHNTAMNDVATAAGVTKPVLYQHFDSKRALYVALLDEVSSRLITTIISATRGIQSGREKTRIGFITYFKWVAEHPREFRLLFGSNDRTDEEFHAITRKLESDLSLAVAPLIDADLNPEHQRTLALGLIGLAIGISQHLVHESRKIEPEIIGEQVAQLAWAGLRSVGR